MPRGIYQHKKGEHKNPETEFKKGNKFGKRFKKGMIPSWKGKPFSEKHKIKLKLARKKRIGRLSPGWKGGIALLIERIRNCFEYRQWRSDVFTRDDFTCQDCGWDKGHILEAHHIKEFSKIIEENSIKTLKEAINCKELWNINNGITLCEKCHKNIKK